jgi:ADP-glucose pyrophosphorylase
MQNSSVGAYTSRGFVEVLAASQSNVRKEWFQGTADAVRQYMWLFEEAMRDGVQDFLILSGEAAAERGCSSMRFSSSSSSSRAGLCRTSSSSQVRRQQSGAK